MSRAQSPVLLLVALLSTVGVQAAAETRLIMVEEQGCVWCERWNAQVAPVYPKSPEGQRAPLQRMDIGDPVPDDLSFDGKFRYTPTFVLVDDGTEIDRIEGYPGQDFFWGMLDRMLRKLDTGAAETD